MKLPEKLYMSANQNYKSISQLTWQQGFHDSKYYQILSDCSPRGHMFQI